MQALYVFGNFIERNINSGRYRLDNKGFICSYLLVRAFRIIRAIFRSERYTTSEESLLLIRSLYEIYCKLTYASRSNQNSKYLIDSDLGLALGYYEFLQKDGKLKRHILVHKKSGKTIPRTRSFYDCVACSPYPEDTRLFEVLYDYLSSFVHSGSRHVLKTWGNKNSGFSLINDDEDEHLKIFVLVLTTLISSMIMQILLRRRKISHISRRDMSLFCYVTRKIVADVGTPKESEISELLPRIKARAAVLPKRVAPFRTDANSS